MTVAGGGPARTPGIVASCTTGEVGVRRARIAWLQCKHRR